jgi:dTDP-4-dehydrorhamnose reductase
MDCAMRIGITGASGMLGSALVDHLSLSYKVFATSRRKGVEGKNIEWDCFDLTDIKLLNEWLEEIKPDVVIHCAAIVDVDACENNVESATKLHVETTKIMVNYLDINDGKLIYISTDSVFDGQKQRSYNEDDLVSPLNVYAETKLMGEQAVLSMNNGLVLRSEIIGWTQKGGISFAEWVLKSLIDKTPLSLFYDVYFSPLTVDDLSFIIQEIIETPIFGLYNCTSSDSISKYDFGKKMAEIFQLPDLNISRIGVDEMNFKAKRPKNMALNSDKLSDKLKYDIPSAIDSIVRMKNQYDIRLKNK